MDLGRENNSTSKLNSMFAELSLDDLEEEEEQGSSNHHKKATLRHNLIDNATDKNSKVGETSDLFSISDLTELEN